MITKKAFLLLAIFFLNAYMPIAYGTTQEEFALYTKKTMDRLEQSEASVEHCYQQLREMMIQNPGRFLNEYIQKVFASIKKEYDTVLTAQEVAEKVIARKPDSDEARKEAGYQLLSVYKAVGKANESLAKISQGIREVDSIARQEVTHIKHQGFGIIVTRQEANIASPKIALLLGSFITATYTPIFSSIAYTEAKNSGQKEEREKALKKALIAGGGTLAACGIGVTGLFMGIIQYTRNQYKKYAAPLKEILDELDITLDDIA